MSVYLIILFVIAGIIAGYLTNLYAVRWLFQPIKRKGILPKWDVSIVATSKKKQKLVNSLANCVANHILTSDVLKEGIPNHLIEQHLSEMIDRLLEEDSNLIHTTKWRDVPGFQQIKEKANNYVTYIMDQKMEPFLCAVLKKEDLSKCLTEEQVRFIANQCYELLEKEAGQKETFHTILNHFYKENRTLTAKKLIGEKQWDAFVQRILFQVLKEKLMECFKNREQLEEVWNIIQSDLAIEAQLDQFQQKLGQKKIGELIAVDGLEQLITYLWKESGKYWKTVEGRRVLRYRKREIIDCLLSMDEPLENLFPEDVWDKIEKWMQHTIQQFIPLMKQWIKKNEEEFNEVITRSIRIAAEKNGRSEYRIWLEEKMKRFLVAQIDISGNLQKILETVKEEESDVIAKQIVELLKTQQVSAWVQIALDKKKRYLWRLLCKDRRWMEHFKRNVCEFLSEKPFSWILEQFSLDFSDFICQRGKNLLFDFMEERPEKAADQLLKWVEPIALEFGTISIENIKEEKLERASECIFSNVNKWIPEKKAEIVSYIERWIVKNGKTFLKTYPCQNAEMLAKSIKDQLMERWQQFGERVEKDSIGQSISYFNKKEWKDTFIKTGVKRWRIGIEEAIQEQIHSLVVDALNHLEPEELCTQVERLMGGQLKYLSYFGGFLGFLIAGSICYWAVPGLSVYGSPTTWTGGIVSVVSMGVIGVITNIVAIWMLFHPRKPIRWMEKSKYLQLFSKGVILQNQGQFAEVMASYVSQQLVSEDAVKQLYEAKKAEFPKWLKQWIDNSGMDWLQKNRNEIARRGIQWMSRQGAKWLKNDLKTKKIQTVVSSDLLIQWGRQETIRTMIVKMYDRWAQSNEKNPLSEWISEETFQKLLLDFLQEKERRWLSSITTESWKLFVIQRESWYKEMIEKQWTLEQKRTFHFLLAKRWEQIDPIEQEEKILSSLIQRWEKLKYDDTLIGEISIGNRSIRLWEELLLEQNMEKGIDWFYQNVLKKKIEETFGYREWKFIEGESRWEMFQKNLTVFGVRTIIEPIFRDAIWELKEVQLPLYLQSKKQELTDCVRLSLEERVNVVPVGDAIVTLFGEHGPATLNRMLFGTVWKNPCQIKDILEKITHMAVNLVTDSAPIVYLRMIGLDSLEAIERNMHWMLVTFARRLLDEERQKRIFAKAMSKRICPVIMRTQVGELSGLLTDTIISNIIDVLDLEKNRRQVIELICRNYCVGQVVSLDELERFLRERWKDEKEVISNKIQSMIEEQIWNFTEYGWKKIPDEVREKWSQIVVEDSSSAFQMQLSEIMKDLNLYRMTKERLLALTPKEMEKIIREFANPIFRMLYVLGGLGAVGGANCYIAILLYFIESRKN